jgi:hypothetical protein
VLDLFLKIGYYDNMMMNEGNLMTDLEINVQALLAAFAEATAAAMADYRDLEESGLMDVFYVEIEAEKEGI